LNSEYFYSDRVVGRMIKNPLDFVIGLYKQFEIDIPKTKTEYKDAYYCWRTITLLTWQLEMRYFDPPDVGGWKAYYQKPKYYKSWITSTNLKIYDKIIDAVTGCGQEVEQTGELLYIDVIDFVAKFDAPFDPGAVVEELANLLFSYPISKEQHNQLKNILVPGLPDAVWGRALKTYLNNTDDLDLRDSLEEKLKLLIKTMLKLPEYFLM